MALSDIDRTLLERCLGHKPRAWEDFVDRFMGLVFHVVNHTAQCRSIMLASADREDLAADVLLEIVRNDYAVLRCFRGESSLATYLTVIARRVVVRRLLESHSATPLSNLADGQLQESDAPADDTPVEQRITDRDEVQRLMEQLEPREADVVRMYHLEGKTYQEISRTVGMPTNSVGPTLTRARTKLREREQSQL